MSECYSFPVPAVTVPESFMHGYPTRLLDSWIPAAECLMLPGWDRAGTTFRVHIDEGTTDHLTTLRTGNRRNIRDLKKYVRYLLAARRSALDVEGSLIFDTRHIAEGNMAHVLMHIAPCVLLAKRIIREQTGREETITVILRARAANLAVRILDLLGIPIIRTDSELSGRLLRIESGGGFLYEPPCFDFPFEGYVRDTPEKIFISRRGARSLLNEAEVNEFLLSRGFTRYEFETIPLSLQWSLLRNARTVVAIHGAAISGLVFAQDGIRPGRRPGDGVRLVELFGPGYIVKCYRELAACYNGTWAAVRGQITPRIIQDLDKRGSARSHAGTPFRVHIGSIEKALNDVHAMGRNPPIATKLNAWTQPTREGRPGSTLAVELVPAPKVRLQSASSRD